MLLTVDALGLLATPQHGTTDDDKSPADVTLERCAVALADGNVDLQPPTLNLLLFSTGGLHESSRGPSWLVAPAAMMIAAKADDSGLLGPILKAWHNGEPYRLGTPICDIGVHLVTVQAADASGNVAEDSIVFEIRARELQKALLVVETLDIHRQRGKCTSIEATVLLGATTFDPWHVHLATTQLFVLDEYGSFLAPGAMVRGMQVCEAPDDDVLWIDCHDMNEEYARYQGGYWRLHYAIDIDGCHERAEPAKLMIAGRSSDTRAPVSFDFIAFAVAREAPYPVEALAAAGGVYPDIPYRDAPFCGPGGDPPVACEWKGDLENQSPDSCEDWDADATECDGNPGLISQESLTRLRDGVGNPRGQGYAIDDCYVGSAATSCSVYATGQYRVWLEPRPPCTRCQIEVRAEPQFRARADLMNPPGRVVVGGHIGVSAGQVQAFATGAVARGESVPTTITFGPDWTVPVEVGAGPEPLDRTFGAATPQVGTLPVCELSAQIGSGGYIDVLANSYLPWHLRAARATGTLFESTPGLTMTATISFGPCHGEQRTFIFAGTPSEQTWD
jgi:hypothetical protein